MACLILASMCLQPVLITSLPFSHVARGSHCLSFRCFIWTVMYSVLSNFSFARFDTQKPKCWRMIARDESGRGSRRGQVRIGRSRARTRRGPGERKGVTGQRTYLHSVARHPQATPCYNPLVVRRLSRHSWQFKGDRCDRAF